MVCCDIACINIQRIDHCFKKIGYEIQLRNQPFEQFVDMYVLVNRYSGKFYFVCMIYQIIISKLQTKNCPIRPYHVPISEFKPPITCTAFSTWIHVRLFIWLFSMRSNAFVFLECIKIAFLYIFGLQACYTDVRASYSLTRHLVSTFWYWQFDRTETGVSCVSYKVCLSTWFQNFQLGKI